MSPSTTSRRVVLLGVPVIALLVVVGTSIALADDLPAQIPSSWQAGTPTDTMGLVPYTAFFGLLVVVLGLVMDLLRRQVGEPVSQRVLGGVGAGVPAALAALHVGILLTVRAQEPPHELPASVLFVAGFVLLAVGALGAAVVQPVERHGTPIQHEPLEIAPGEAVVWTGSSSAPAWSWALVATVVAVAAVLLVVDLPWVALLLVVLAAAATTLLRVTVTIGPAGVTARLGPLRLVRFHTPLEDIAVVHAEVVDPLTYGGWGLRWLPGVRGVILRSGPGLRIEQTDGPDLVVTVDDAAEAAGVLQAHVDRVRVG